MRVGVAVLLSQVLLGGGRAVRVVGTQRGTGGEAKLEKQVTETRECRKREMGRESECGRRLRKRWNRETSMGWWSSAKGGSSGSLGNSEGSP